MKVFHFFFSKSQRHLSNRKNEARSTNYDQIITIIMVGKNLKIGPVYPEIGLQGITLN